MCMNKKEYPQMYLKSLRNYIYYCKYNVKGFCEMTISFFHTTSESPRWCLAVQTCFHTVGRLRIPTMLNARKPWVFHKNNDFGVTVLLRKLPLFLWKMETPTNNVFSSYLLIRKLIELHMYSCTVLIKCSCSRSTDEKQICRLV